MVYFPQQTPKPSFLVWHKDNKTELQKERPDLAPAEMTKYAMNKYKALFNNDKNNTDNGNGAKSTTTNAKRKINTDDAAQQSGIAKLAKFNFSK